MISLFGVKPTPAMLRNYSWHCAQESLLKSQGDHIRFQTSVCKHPLTKILILSCILSIIIITIIWLRTIPDSL